MTGRGRAVCKVCKRPASQRDALWDAVWRHRGTGRQQLLAVHPGACARALESQWILTTEEAMADKKEPEKVTTDVEPGPGLDPEAAAVLADEGVQNPPAVIDADADASDPDAEPITEAELLGSEADLPEISTRDVVEWIRSKRPLPKFDPEDVARAIAWQIITAPSLEEALSSGEMMAAQENLYTTLTITGVKWQPSSFEDQGSPVYAVLTIVDPTSGEHRMMTCGGMNVVASMVKADLAGEFPIRCRFTTADTRSGNQTLKVELVRPDPNEGVPLDQQQF